MPSTPFALSLSKGSPPSQARDKGKSGLRQAQAERWWVALCALVMLALAAPAAAQTFPELTGRVVDGANLLSPEQEAELTAKLAQLETASSRQMVVATVPDLQGYPIEDFGYRLGRAWQIGQAEANNGIILLVAPTERKVRVEVGYGLEPIVTDALSHQIIQDTILPRFRQGDMPAGILAGADALIGQLGAPPEAQERRVLEASQAAQARSSGGGGSIVPLIFWIVILFFVIIPMFRRGFGGKTYRGRRRRGPVVIWGPGLGSGGWGGGGGSSWGGGGGGFGGGFGGGGGSFGGGGASGGW